MAKFKIKDSVWNVIAEGLKIYFSNIIKFTHYMLFPVFGQIIGLALIFGLTGWIGHSKLLMFNNFTVLALALLLASLPGFAIFLKAFWDYLVAYGALNSMIEAVISTGKLYDLKAHTQVVTNRSVKFIALLLVISVLSLIAIFPPFWALGVIFFVYFILVFQVFTFEEDKSIYECFRRSLYLVKGNFGRTVSIMLVVIVICHIVITFAATFLCDITKISYLLKGILENWALNLPLNEVNETLSVYKLPAITPLEIARQILSSLILFTVTGLTLPLRSSVWTVWYKNLVNAKNDKTKKIEK